jgi:hypothetical protein
MDKCACSQGWREGTFKIVNLKPSLAKTPAEVSRRVIVTLALGVQVAKKLSQAWVAPGGRLW